MNESPWLSFQAPKDCLKDKRILITGAGLGIGACLAKTCAGLGAEILLLGHTQARLEKTYDDIIESGGSEPSICLFDLHSTDAGAYETLAENIDESVGGIDGLVHNAGLLGQVTPIANYNPRTWMSVMQINLNAGFLLTRAMLPLLQESQAGRILFTSSGVGRTGVPHWGAYAVSKFAVEGLTQVLAGEMEGTSKITVNAINPGPTRTRMRAQAFPAEDPATLPTPEDLMPTYMYFMSDESAAVNGLSVDAQ